MHTSIYAASAALLATTTLAAPPSPHSDPFKNIARQANAKRQASGNSSSPQVDLGYEIYRGYYNDTSDLDIYKGIRFAAPPLGEYRWQAPYPPEQNRSNVIDASDYGPICPQTSNGGGGPPEDYGDEDCLFLNVWSPPNAENLPVYVWIHGGGYGAGSGQSDLSYIINDNDNSFVGVTIQYRLGAFGFLSSDEVFRNGVVNAGILDQTFALKWVQNYIHLFGGNASQVTISGESAGGGAVMLQTMAYGGSLGTTLFENVSLLGLFELNPQLTTTPRPTPPPPTYPNNTATPTGSRRNPTSPSPPTPAASTARPTASRPSTAPSSTASSTGTPARCRTRVSTPRASRTRVSGRSCPSRMGCSSRICRLGS